ncbi:hypothetical protein CY35_12G008200 [Sphagnum magellanicum]|nr:hypothetical protein CY35_12G008200 [Sphagnum magellanicum]
MVVCSRMDALHVFMRLGDGGSRFGDDNRSSKFEVEQRRRGTLRAAAAAASSSSRRGENIVPMIASGKQSSEVSTFVTLGYSLDRGAKFGNKTIFSAGGQESIPGSELSDAAAAMEQSRDNLEEATGTMPETSEPGDSPASDEDAVNLEGSEEQFTENPQAPAAAAPVTETEKASFSSASDTLNTTSGTARDWRVFSNGVRDFKNWDEDHDAR